MQTALTSGQRATLERQLLTAKRIRADRVEERNACLTAYEVQRARAADPTCSSYKHNAIAADLRAESELLALKIGAADVEIARLEAELGIEAPSVQVASAECDREAA